MEKGKNTLKFFDKISSASWLVTHGFKVNHEGQPARPYGTFWRKLEVSQEAREQLIMAWKLAHLFADKAGLFWFTDWPLSSDDEMELFLSTRRRYSEDRLLIDAPSFLFNTTSCEEKHYLTEMIFLAFAFNWEGFIFCEDKSVIVWLADEIVEIVFANLQEFSKFE